MTAGYLILVDPQASHVVTDQKVAYATEVFLHIFLAFRTSGVEVHFLFWLVSSFDDPPQLSRGFGIKLKKPLRATPDNPDNACPAYVFRGCWHIISVALIRYIKHHKLLTHSTP